MKHLINFAVVTFMVTLSGIFGLNSQKTENLSETAKANIEALESVNDAIPDKCKGCASDYTGRYCCTISFNGVLFDIFHYNSGSEYPTE